MSEIKEHMEVVGADGVHVGTVDKIDGNRIKLTKMSATGAVAVTMERGKKDLTGHR